MIMEEKNYYCERCGKKTHCEFCDECLAKHANGEIDDDEE